MNKKLLTVLTCILSVFGFSINASAVNFTAGPVSVAEVNSDDAVADEGITETININALDVETSSNESTAGDINEDRYLDVANFSVIVSPKASGNTNNRFWATKDGPELRVYNGTITVKAAAGKVLNKIVFGQTQWGVMTADNGILDGQTWTGEAQTVVFTVSSQCRISSITATVSEAAATEAEVSNIAGLKTLADGTSVKLALNNTRVTVNEVGMRGSTIIIEDESGAIKTVSSMFDPGFADVLPDAFGSAGVVLNGYLYCKYVNDGFGTIGISTSDKTSESEIEVTQAEIYPTIMTVSEACDEANDNRFVEFQNVQMVYDESSFEYNIVQGDSKITLVDSYIKMDYDDDYRMIVYDNLKYIRGVIVSVGDGKFWLNPIGNPAFEADASATVTEVSNIAGLKTLADGAGVKLALNNTRVTVNEVGMRGSTIIIEDESGAIKTVSSMFDPGFADVLPDAFGSAGVVLNGYLYCKYVNDGFGTIGISTSDKTSESEIEVTQAEIYPTIMTVSEACDEANDNRFVEFQNVQMVYDESSFEYNIVQGDSKITLVDSYIKMDYDDDYRMIVYDNLKYIRGVIVSVGDGKFWLNPIGNPAFEADASATVTDVANIASLRSLADGTNVKLTLSNAKVTVNEVGMRSRTVIIEDESGAISLASSMFDPGLADVLPDVFGSAGVVLNGYLYCKYVNDGFGTLGILPSDKTSESEIEVTKADIEPTVMTVSEACDEANDCRYVEFQNVEMVYDESTFNYYIVQGDSKISLIDTYMKMDYDDDYRMIVYDNLKYIRGIVLSVGDGQFWFNPIGDPAFKVDDASGIDGVYIENGVLKSNVYSVDGVMVRKAGEKLDGLTKGLYIVGGKKISIK